MNRRLRLDWRRVFVYTHRWLGIGGCLLFITWFASGIVMMYARMPALTTEERLAHLPPLRVDQVRVSPDDAARAAGITPRTVRLTTINERPAYRFATGRGSTAVFADTGDAIGRASANEALAIAKAFLPEHAATMRYEAQLDDADQWTLSPRPLFPVHRIDIGDEAGTQLYVSEPTAEIVMKTTARERRWAYAGAVLHWLYFTPFRRNAAVWAQSIIWLSIAGSAMCLFGIVWGVWRYSPVQRYRLKHVPQHSPYAGMMHWHHYAGLIFGLTTFTWIFSGLLSMDPWDWHPSTSPTRAQSEAVSAGPLRLNAVTVERLTAAMATVSPTAPKEIEIVQFQGDAFIRAHDAGRSRLVSIGSPDRGALARFDEAAMMTVAKQAMPGIDVDDAAWLNKYDAYYYDRDGLLALPVLRVRYADPQRTWLYLDPSRGAIARKEERWSRVNRWLYHGLHSLDFPFLYYRRPLWDVVVIALTIGGIVSSVTAVTPAWRRLRRHAVRWRRHG